MPSERQVIDATSTPATVATLTSDLAALGVRPGGVVIVHTAMSALGWVAGGAQSVVEALVAAVGPTGTIVMPSQSGQLTDPGGWNNPPVPAEWVDVVRSGLPAYDPVLTPARSMGAVVDCFLQHRDMHRSPHPTVSFAALGPQAAAIVDEHPVCPETGETSPLGRLYELDAQVLLLGVDHGNNTSLHLAEDRADWDGKSWVPHGAPMMVDGERTWVTWDDLDSDDGDFEQLGDAFALTGAERVGRVGSGVGRLVDMAAIVDFAVNWMNANRPGSLN